MIKAILTKKVIISAIFMLLFAAAVGAVSFAYSKLIGAIVIIIFAAILGFAAGKRLITKKF